MRISQKFVDIARNEEPLHQGIHVVREVYGETPKSTFKVQFIPAYEGEMAADVDVRYEGVKSRLSEQHVRTLLTAQEGIPEELQGSILLFPGIILALERMEFTPHPVVRMKHAMMSARYEEGKWQAAVAWIDGICRAQDYIVTLCEQE